MASAPRYNVNLGLPAVPEVDNPDTMAAVSPVYNALRALAAGLDIFTGTAYVDPSEYSSMSPANTIITANHAKIYKKCAVAINAYYTVGLNASDQAVLGTSGTVIGFAAAKGAIGDWIPIILCGYFPVSGVTPGTLYRASGTAGLVMADGANQALGFAVSTSGIYFNPNLT